ncbi:hypothetical protein HT136_00895 [Novosphingobium profundi]|uniref:hypothetical protein n=1 Tax=Novosphingobium profundi TaxID=1774954 RepID=UPI001BDA3C4B|nr:hypothetical protein [Novosphingobium profundi]MBT0666926.1 hypothetical protein [Novosphingobium profundi]
MREKWLNTWSGPRIPGMIEEGDPYGRELERDLDQGLEDLYALDFRRDGNDDVRTRVGSRAA